MEIPSDRLAALATAWINCDVQAAVALSAPELRTIVELIVSRVPFAYRNAGQGHLLYELILRQVVETKGSTKWNVGIRAAIRR
jgi:hypothetical protein